MAFVVADRVQQLSTTAGTGALMPTSTSNQCRAFSAVMATGDTCPGLIVSSTTGNWEISQLTLQADGSLLRTFVAGSTSSTGSLINFGSESKTISLIIARAWSIFADNSGNVAVPHNLTVNGGNLQVLLTGNGYAAMNIGGPSNSGYTAFYTAAGARVGYVGWGIDRIYYIAELAGSIHEWQGPGGLGWARLNSIGLAVSANDTLFNPLAKLHVKGGGQATGSPSTSTGVGSAIYLQDSGVAAGNGGMVIFGAGQGAFAAIKGYITDGSNNTMGDLVIATREVTTDAALTEQVRLTRQGRLSISAGSAPSATIHAIQNDGGAEIARLEQTVAGVSGYLIINHTAAGSDRPVLSLRKQNSITLQVSSDGGALGTNYYEAIGASAAHKFYSGGSYVCQVTGVGLAIGTSSAPTYQLDAIGSANAVSLGVRAANSSTGASAAARMDIELSGVANGYTLLQISNNSGTPNFQIAGGTGLTGGFQCDFPVSQTFRISGVDQLVVDGSSTHPGADNTKTLGTASLRWSVVYAGTGTINTSDETDKTNIRTLTDIETTVAVALASKVQAWQWKDAVVAKGVDGARLHVGLTAQVVRDTFIAAGLEPFRYGCVGFDPLNKLETYTETRSEPKTQMVDVEQEEVEVINGVPTLTTKTVQQSQAVGTMTAIVDAAGNPVMQKLGEEPTGQFVQALDANNQPVMRPGVLIDPETGAETPVQVPAMREVMRDVMVPRMHFVQEMESVTIEHQRMVPELDTKGQPVLRMNVRPDQLSMWVAYGLAHRLAALEAKVP